MRTEVACTYCQRIMGWEENTKTVGADGKERVIVVVEDNFELPPVCTQSPNEQHANMTPEQAGDRGLA